MLYMWVGHNNRKANHTAHRLAKADIHQSLEQVWIEKIILYLSVILYMLNNLIFNESLKALLKKKKKKSVNYNFRNKTLQFSPL